MQYPPTGENATELTAPMLEALHGCNASDPKAFNIRSIPTAQALMSRGFVQRIGLGAPLSVNSQYVITERGRTAYRITKRLAGVEDNACNICAEDKRLRHGN
jgi:hypothetical protein